MKSILFNYDNILPFASEEKIKGWQAGINEAGKFIRQRTGKGSGFLGWYDLPLKITEKTLSEIETAAKQVISQADSFVSIGIGGSYLGAKAVIEAVKENFYNEKPGAKPKMYFAGQNISSVYAKELRELIEKTDVAINVISKSGTTTEPGIGFRVLRELVEKKYGKKAKDRIFATTSETKGALVKLARACGYKTFYIPEDVGGRFSVLTPVGLFPIAVAGINIRELVQGARDMAQLCGKSDKLFENPACTYASVRNQLLKSGKIIEVLSVWNPKLHFLGEWWKQLFGESEGKEGKGIFPAICDFTTDLHSVGQYLQEGQRVLFETFVMVDAEDDGMRIGRDPDDIDEMNYLEGRNFDYINKKAAEGTAKAHLDGGVPNAAIHLPELNAYYVGQLLYFFELSCAYSGYLLGVNPFDQPGVEVYKKNMFKLLNKPGA